jgi:hypothetical protein
LSQRQGTQPPGSPRAKRPQGLRRSPSWDAGRPPGGSKDPQEAGPVALPPQGSGGHG